MTRTLYKWDSAQQKMVEVWCSDNAKAVEPTLAPWVQGDEIPPTESMATANREIFTSLSKLKAHYKQHGYVMTGGDHLSTKMTNTPQTFYKADRQEIRDEVAKALNDIRWGNAPISERERESCKREQRMYQEYVKRMRG